ncbi:unnamed protein product [Moneuplotes crassus]|uniref:Uncharacterized protein n=1 Tax=Euplotes crassus TaxID=5936 RepID=A0AAD1XQY2_EUPCR|nr:unnamed protein product [Moneuplotes crassus]
MEFDKTDYFVFRETVYRSSASEIKKMLKEAKNEIKVNLKNSADEGIIFVSKLEYIRMLLTIHIVKESEVDFDIFEDIYQTLMSPERSEALPLKYKAEFAFLFFVLFLKNGAYSRCEKLMKTQRDLYKKNKEDAYVAFKYFSTFLSVSPEYLTVAASTPHEYFYNVFDKIAEMKFPPKVMTELTFRKKKLLAEYYLSRDIQKCIPINEELLAICAEDKSLHYLVQLCDIFLSSQMKPYKCVRKFTEEAKKLIEVELETHPEPELSICQLVLLKLDKEQGEHRRDVCEGSQSGKIKQSLCRITILLSSLPTDSFALNTIKTDKDLIPSKIREKLSKKFVKIYKVQENLSDSFYLRGSLEAQGSSIPFVNIKNLAFIIDMLCLMGIQVDFDIVKKYAQDMEEDKLSYILFLSSIGTSQDFNIESQLFTAFEFCEDLDIHKLHQFRINIDFQLMSQYMKGHSFGQIEKGKRMLESMTLNYEKNRDEMINQKLLILYQTQMNLATTEGNTQMYIENAEKFLCTYNTLNTECNTLEPRGHSQNIASIYCSLIEACMMQTNMYKAIMVSNDFLKFAAQEGEETKQYHTALEHRVNLAWIQKDIMTFIDLSHKLADIANHVYGRISAEHAYGVQMVSRSFTVRMQYKEAFREIEKSYKILIEVHGSEYHQQSSNILFEMAIIKGHLKEFDEAFLIIKKSKRIESQMTSEDSSKYNEIMQAEEILTQMYEKYLIKHPESRKPRYTKSKVTAATLLFATMSYATFRYFRKTNQ